MTTYNPRQLSEWLIAVSQDGNKVIKAAFTLTSKVPSGVVHKTILDRPNTDFIIYWYMNKPSEWLEKNIEVFIADWLADGRLG